METRDHISVNGIVLPSPWEALLISVSAFPIPVKELAVAAGFVHNLVGRFADRREFSWETFVQVEQSDDKECRRIYLERAREWIPEVGLGVWPDREPPAAWTQEEFKNLSPGERPRTLMHQVLRITGSAKAKLDAADAMLPFGPLLQIITADDGEIFLEKTTSVLLPPIKDPSYTCYPFYVPLLEVKSLTSAAPAQLERWLSGASMYVRESFEDNGILIVSREPLTSVLEKLHGGLEKGELVWRIPC